jgi:hypothetical protein
MEKKREIVRRPISRSCLYYKYGVGVKWVMGQWPGDDEWLINTDV